MLCVAVAATVLALPGAASALPLGDASITSGAPAPGLAFTCRVSTGTPFLESRPWLGDTSYDAARRPIVDGEVFWPDARFVVVRRPRTRAFTGSGQPVGHTTGVFPPRPSDDAAPFVDGATAIAARGLRGSFRRSPVEVERPACIDPGLPVAVGVDGVPILPPFSAAGLDAVAREVVDRCGGRTDGGGLYYRRLPACGAAARGRAGKTTHSPLVGYARDGFGLYGPRGPRGRDLDACHGHSHRVTMEGVVARRYHYHLTSDFPHTLGCFAGRPAATWRIDAAPVPRPAADPPPDPPPDSPPTQPPPVQDSELPGLSTEPPLFPAFDLAESDYVVACDPGDPGDPVRVSVSAPEGTRVAVDGRSERGGSFTEEVALEHGRAFRSRARTAAGREATYHIRCLPPDFPSFSVERPGAPQGDFYISTPNLGTLPPGQVRPAYGVIFDDRGVPVWWRKAPAPPLDAEVLASGHVIWYERWDPRGTFGTDPLGGYTEQTLAGDHVRLLRTVGSPTDTHDVEQLPNGNYLLLSYVPRDHVDLSAYGGPPDATVVDSEIQEIEADGDLVWEWNSKDHISLDETGRWWPTVIAEPAKLADGRDAYDPVHINSVALDGDGLVISLRHTDAVLRIKRPSGAIDWKLGGTATPERLTIEGDAAFGSSSFGGQHDARVEPDGTIALLDNGTGLGRPPRAVRYRLDLATRTAILLEDVREPQASQSVCCGSARRLPGGNWVIGWGGVFFFSELTPAGEVALRVTFRDVFSYRTVPVAAGLVTAEQLRTAMDAMNPR